MKHLGTIIIICFSISFCVSCSNSDSKEVVNIGYIGPLSGRAEVLGVWPAKALELAVAKYNDSKRTNMPLVNLVIKDDGFSDDNALPLYNDLKQNSNVDIVFISNSGGTVAIADQALKDDVIVINPLNNDELLNTLNDNVFKIAKKTEEMAQIISNRLIDLRYKKVTCIHFENDFMSRITNTIEEDLKDVGIEVIRVSYKTKENTFKKIINEQEALEADAIVFGGYTEIAFAMKELREAGVKAPFYSINNTIPTPGFYTEAGEAVQGTEFAYFTSTDGNYVLAAEFLDDYEQKFGALPPTIWPAMQSYDAMNIVLNAVKKTEHKAVSETYSENLKYYLQNTKYHKGVSGNIRITEDGSSRGIYFSLYTSLGEDKLTLVRR